MTDMNRLDRRRFIGGSLAAATAGAMIAGSSQKSPAASQGNAYSSPPGKRPNILWLIAEDLGPELACYGTPEVWTPNLDRLASEGVRFTNMFTVTPVCSSSRSSFMTGMYASSIGAQNHRSHRGDGYKLPPGVRVLTDWLRDAGYKTANLRQLSDDPKEPFFRGTGKTDWNFTYESKYGKPFDSDKWSDLKGSQPFYAQINFSETHRGAAWNNAQKNIERTADPAKIKLPPYYPDHPMVRADWAQYLNTVMSLDRKIGFVLQRLEEDGLADNTVVIFMGDHGRAHVRGKQWPYDSGLHIPFIVRWPKNFPAPAQIKTGTVDDRLLCSLDLTATTLWIAGVEPPLTMQGRVFLGDRAIERTFAFGMRDRGDETVDRIRSVRDKRYRYIRNFYPERPFLQLNRYKEDSYPMIYAMRRLNEEGRLNEVQARLLAPTRPKEELYDIEKDPYEINNLADSPEHQLVKARLSGALDAWIVETNDQGRFPEDPAIPTKYEKSMAKTYNERLKKSRERYRKMFEEAERELKK